GRDRRGLRAGDHQGGIRRRLDRAMTTADLGRFSEGFAAFRRMLASVAPADRLPIFTNAAAEVAKYVSKGLSRTVAADELADMATAYDVGDTDLVQGIISRAFEHMEEQREQPQPNGKANGKQSPKGILFLAKKGFMGGFVPPDYLIEGMLQRRFVYALTGQTGHAKTAIALLFAELISTSDANAALLGSH